MLGCDTVPIKYSIRAHTKGEEDFRIVFLLFTFNFSVDALKSIPDSRYSQGLVGFLCWFNSDRDTCRSVALRELVNSSEGRKEGMINYSPHTVNYKKHDCCLSDSFSFLCTYTLSLCYLCNYIIFIQTISRETCFFEYTGTFIFRVLHQVFLTSPLCASCIFVFNYCNTWNK